MSAFGGRQEVYEFFFFGDPVRMAQAMVGSYDRAPYTDRIPAASRLIRFDPARVNRGPRRRE